MNTPRYTSGIATAILLLACLVSTNSVIAEDCYLDIDDNGTGDNTADAETYGDDYRLACGREALASGKLSVAVGASAWATGDYSMTVGANTDASDTYATAIGYSATATAEYAAAIGSWSDASDSYATALGYSAKATAENAIAIGANAVASVANTVILGSPSATTKVGINTSTPSDELAIHSHSPAIRLDDISADHGRVDLDMSENEFAIEGESNHDIVEIDTRAPEQALAVRRDGDVGIGMRWADVDLHVRGEGDGEEEELLRLESAVPPRLTMKNLTSDLSWSLAMTAGNVLNILYLERRRATFFKSGDMYLAGTLTQNSDRDSKTAIVPVNNRKILDAVVDLPISTWEYKSSKGVKHLGPMGQDFHAAFGLGDTPKGISSIDTGGVALAAIKGLNESLNLASRTRRERGVD